MIIRQDREWSKNPADLSWKNHTPSHQQRDQDFFEVRGGVRILNKDNSTKDENLLHTYCKIVFIIKQPRVGGRVSGPEDLHLVGPIGSRVTFVTTPLDGWRYNCRTVWMVHRISVYNTIITHRCLPSHYIITRVR